MGRLMESEFSWDCIQGVTAFIEAALAVTESKYNSHYYSKACNRNALSEGTKWTDVRLEDKARPADFIRLALTIHLLLGNKDYTHKYA